MIFEQIATGGDRNFAYLVGDDSTRKAAVFDPANDPKKVMSRAKHYGLEVVYLFNTHSHMDHAGGNDVVQERANVDLITGELALDDAEYSLGDVTLKVIHTPGHTQDGICILVTAPNEPGRLITRADCSACHHSAENSECINCHQDTKKKFVSFGKKKLSHEAHTGEFGIE
ncbi:MAG: MBL fold metallo-hydrolase, partial [Planctomycetes bacterium]|nr:MBL fold metallo-hydrolase [Planctomycetota bacterium]